VNVSIRRSIRRCIVVSLSSLSRKMSLLLELEGRTTDSSKSTACFDGSVAVTDTACAGSSTPLLSYHVHSHHGRHGYWLLLWLAIAWLLVVCLVVCLFVCLFLLAIYLLRFYKMLMLCRPSGLHDGSYSRVWAVIFT